MKTACLQPNRHPITRTILPLGTALLLVFVGACSSGNDPASAQAAKPYPLDTCAVTGEKIGADPDMKPYSFVHAGQEIKLCCKGCLKDFQKEPDTYLKKLAAASQKAP